MSAVIVAGVAKAFGRTVVLDGVDLCVPHASITAVLGSSGCGKSTLLRIIAGFVRPDAGTVQIGGRIVDDERTRVRPERRGVGYVPQEGALFPHLTVADNILFGLPRAARTRTRLAELLDLAELPADIADRPPHEISGGQQQRVALARALAPRPAVILLDEPFSSLDAALRISAGRAVTRVLRNAGATAMLVTHDQGEALSLADQVAVMRAGRFVQADTPTGLYEHPVDPETARFVGGATVLGAVVHGGAADTALGRIGVCAADGPAELMLRPEQVRIVAAGAGAVDARVGEVSFFGARVAVSLVLDDGTVVAARGPSTATPAVGDRVGLLVDGDGVAFPRESAS
jgi:iron(III) transport system ATP-binding protein